MQAIPFTQFLMPDGRQERVFIDRPDDIAANATIIFAAGYRLECEMLSDYRTCSFTVTNDDEDFDIEQAPNGPGVVDAVDRLINRASERLRRAS